MQYEQRFNNKVLYLVIGTGIALSIICFRLYYLQIKVSSALYNQAQKNCIRMEKVLPPRGNIVDRNNNLLATNKPITALVWQGTGNAKLNAEQYELLQILAAIIEKPLTIDGTLLEHISYAERKHKKFELCNELSFEQLSKIEEQLTTHPNIHLATSFKRFYPYDTFGCHILGYLGNIRAEPQGKMGLEKLFEEELKGEDGALLKKINSVGRNLAEIELKEALCGKTLQTTLDINIQDIVEQIFPADMTGTFIVMDPERGDILALVSRPNFNPNIFVNPVSPEEWRKLQDKQPFLNRAFNSCYPPGSIFKLSSISAALETGIVKESSSIYCPGYVTFCDRNYYCACRTGHGPLTISQAVAKSCNVLFFDLARHMSIDTLALYASKFGLGQKTNLLFSEQEGLIPTSAWKMRVKRERWWPGETLSASIGQSYLLVTPIQVARMISSIFTGYLTNPRILLDKEIEKTPLEIEQSTLDFLKESMRSVVTKGTGLRVNRVKNIEIYAKTSTAQTSNFDKRHMGTSYLEHGWFVAYFKYLDHAPVTMVVMVENAGTSRVATNVAKNFLVEYKRLMDSRL
jgi:penicillin-binding protein 2